MNRGPQDPWITHLSPIKMTAYFSKKKKKMLARTPNIFLPDDKSLLSHILQNDLQIMKPTQIEVNRVLTTSRETPDQLDKKTDDVESQISPTTKKKNVDFLILHRTILFPILSLKTFPWKTVGHSGARIWALATQTPCLVPAVNAALSFTTTLCQYWLYTHRPADWSLEM